MDIHGLKLLYELKAGTKMLAEEHPEMNLNYCMYLLDNMTELLRGEEKRRAVLQTDADRLQQVLEYLVTQGFDGIGWACVTADNLGTFTFCNQQGKGFAVYTDEKHTHLTSYTVLSAEHQPESWEPDYETELGDQL